MTAVRPWWNRLWVRACLVHPAAGVLPTVALWILLIDAGADDVDGVVFLAAMLVGGVASVAATAMVATRGGTHWRLRWQLGVVGFVVTVVFELAGFFAVLLAAAKAGYFS